MYRLRRIVPGTLLVLALAAGVAVALEGKQAAKTPAPAAKAEEKPAPGDPAAGKKLFKKDCSICHFDTAATRRVGLGLKGLYKRDQLPTAAKPVTDASLRAIIAEGMTQMPPFKFSKKEMDDLLAYLKTL